MPVYSRIRLYAPYLLLLSYQQKARADMGVPMLVLTWPAMVIALLPIVLIESAYLSRRYSVTIKRSLRDVGIANLVTTIVGIPISWLVMLAIQMAAPDISQLSFAKAHPNSPLLLALGFVMQTAWLAPYEGQMYWMVPTAALVLLIPFTVRQC